MVTYVRWDGMLRLAVVGNKYVQIAEEDKYFLLISVVYVVKKEAIKIYMLVQKIPVR